MLYTETLFSEIAMMNSKQDFTVLPTASQLWTTKYVL